MAKATITIRQSLKSQGQHADWFAATQRLFNQVAAFYFMYNYKSSFWPLLRRCLRAAAQV